MSARSLTGKIAASMLTVTLAGTGAAAEPATPIRHVVVVVGENHAFDTLFATFKPESGATIGNLLSRGIVDELGNPGPNFSQALQRRPASASRYAIGFADASPYEALPRAWTKPKSGNKHPDERMPADLRAGPYPITRYVPYGTPPGADPVHRFFQMWQQVHGGRNDLFVWVGETSGEGSTQKGNPSSGTNRGGEAMGFYNMSKGDVPVFERLARRYALADNYHQPIMGGTMPNYIALATAGDAAVYLSEGKPVPPPIGEQENPEPRPGTANWYVRSGYSSGSYAQCGDLGQPGVAPIHNFLKALPYGPFRDGNCVPGEYYLLNNYSPPYKSDGSLKDRAPYVATAQVKANLGEALARAGVSWKWYSSGRDGERTDREYCPECDPLSYFTGIMETPLRTRLQGYRDFQADVDREDLPAVSVIVPPNSRSGHPGYSNIARLESFVEEVIGRIESRPGLWRQTVVFVTFDEGGGYYDSGPVQFIDFFGDGTRIPLIAVSPWAKQGHVEHTYYDHASLLKFIERNWAVAPLSPRSRDNLPNPLPGPDPYTPGNRPAIGDLFEMFDFTKR